jgi:sulfate adenylyltransferase
MNKVAIPDPHGGQGLINRVIPEIERDSLIKNAGNKIYTISDADLSVFYRIADGALSPLTGPMDSKEFNQVLQEEVIERNNEKYAWTIPLAFPIHKAEAEKLSIGETIKIKNSKTEIIGTLKISDIYPFDKKEYNKSVYGTDRNDHPGARIFNNDPRDYLLGGEIWALPPKPDQNFGRYMISPFRTRALFKRRNWERIVAFQTRNALHRAHEYALLYATEQLIREGNFTGAVLNPLVGATKSDDVPADVRMKTYEALLKSELLGQGDRDDELWKNSGQDFFENLILIGLDMKMYYAGPKEAIMHAIYRQNYGFTDIVIGRKHADAPFDDGEAIWGDFDAHDKFDNLNGKLDIKAAKVGFAAYYKEIERVGLIKDFKPKGYETVFISGKEVRKQLLEGNIVDERIVRKPVSEILIDFYKNNKPQTQKSSNVVWHETVITKEDREKFNKHRGAVLWLTGLSGCGKSTVATCLEQKLFDLKLQTIILDGDNIRHGLNGDLGFSPQDRDENIRRIGQVAKLFAQSGTLTITSFISPYRKGRNNARTMNNDGDFVEVFVKAPLEVCEERDPKGLYVKARKGIIPEFTGISAPYEEPETPEIIIETDKLSVEESADKIIQYLRDNKYIF